MAKRYGLTAPPPPPRTFDEAFAGPDVSPPDGALNTAGTAYQEYLAEFDFRYNNRAKLGVNDPERAATLAAGIVGKRLTYRRPH